MVGAPCQEHSRPCPAQAAHSYRRELLLSAVTRVSGGGHVLVQLNVMTKARMSALRT